MTTCVDIRYRTTGAAAAAAAAHAKVSQLFLPAAIRLHDAEMITKVKEPAIVLTDYSVTISCTLAQPDFCFGCGTTASLSPIPFFRFLSLIHI